MPAWYQRETCALIFSFLDEEARDHFQTTLNAANAGGTDKYIANIFSGDLPKSLSQEDRDQILGYLDAIRE